MKKELIITTLMLMGTFISCNKNNGDDPLPKPPVPQRDIAYEAEGLYSVITAYNIPDSTQGSMEAEDFRINKSGEGYVKIETPFIQIGKEIAGKLGTITIDSIPISETENSFVFVARETDKINVSNFVSPKAEVNGIITNGELLATIRLYNDERTISFNFTGTQIAFDEAKILDVKINNPNITAGPEIKGKEITFYLHPETDMTKLEMTPELTLSKGATSMPRSGVTIDFAKYKDYTVEYTIIAEDQSIDTYKIKLLKGGDLSHNNFEDWILEDNDNKFYKPSVNWATSNPGITMIIATGKMMGVNYKGGAIVLPEEKGMKGKGAKIVTANTIGGASILPGVFPSIPKITSGSLFTGTFKIDAMNTLNSTQFGIPYFQKPTNVKGYFKYIPGKDYYYCPDPKQSEIAEIDPNKKDECALSAVLYEVEDFSDFLNGENIFTSDKIVAIAQQFKGETQEYTAFDLKLEYKKEYDPSKKYRFAIIFSSSKDGASFSGAENSALYVDEIEVINE